MQTNEQTNQGGRGDVEAELRAQLERERGEVAFLRNIVEGQQRDAIELRQALKRALDLAPKQLTAGESSTKDLSPTDAAPAPSVSDASDAPLDSQSANAPNPTPGAVKSPAERQARPLWKVVLGIR